ncbi:MAG: acyl-CoA synthetase FdrA [Thermoanaerobaculia bacterium]|nr:acyl-CoA synthetase FdrA [Thermoanaerobaculia bacterium]
MSVLLSAVRPGAYRDSIILMQLQAALAELPGIDDAGAVMATPENLALLGRTGLLPEPAPAAGSADLLVVVRADTREQGDRALARIDDLLRRETTQAEAGYRPRSLQTAVRALPAARFALISIPGRFAAAVASQALDLGLHVLLYSDNVELADEARLKRRARGAGLLLMGPDCGTAYVGGIGLGFANRVRRGHIGIVAASGTGLQTVACGVHALGAGISHGIGTGGRDLHPAVGSATALQALDLLRRDPGTRVIVLISKPPAPEAADRLLTAAAATGKPVVVAFQGYRRAAGPRAAGRLDPGIRFAADLGEAATIAVSLADGTAPGSGPPATSRPAAEPGAAPGPQARAPRDRLAPYLRGLFSGGTLAVEALLGLRGRLPSLYSNLAAEGVMRLEDPEASREHTVLDLGADEFTVARPHPMIDNDLRVRRFRREAADPHVGLILLDIVLGYGAHDDPASELAPVIAETRRPDLAVVAIVVGTDEDPQGLEDQIGRLTEAGAVVLPSVTSAVSFARARLPDRQGSADDADAEAGATAAPASGDDRAASASAAMQGSGAMQGPGATQAPAVMQVSAATAVPVAMPAQPGTPVSLSDLDPPIGIINIGLERFGYSLIEQGAEVVQMEWRPPAGGNDRLWEILEKMRR